MRLSSTLTASVIAAAVLSAPARTQEPRRLAEPDSIPLELATALAASGGFGGEPQIIIGSVPEWIAPRLFVPSGAHILGSAFLGTTMVAIVTVPTTSDSVLAEVRRGLMQKGWTAPPPPPVYGGGGFRSATTPVGLPFGRDVLCNDQQMLTASATRRRGVATDVTLRVNTATVGYNSCHPMQPNQPNVRNNLPTLYNPIGASDPRMSAECTSAMSSNSMGTGARLRTPMTADALLDHYGKQLADSGWSSTASPERNTITGRTWTRPDSSGAPMEVTITVTSSARESGCRELNMQVRTLRKP